MKRLRKFLRQPRFFLSVIVMPLLVLTNECPPIFNPPQPPNNTCQINLPLTLDTRKCAVVEPPCAGTLDWQSGDTFSITKSQTGSSPFDVFNNLFLDSSEIRSGNTLMRRVCQEPGYTISVTNGRALYQYTFQNTVGEGTYNINFINQSALTVSIDSSGISPAVYDYKHQGDSVVLLAQVGGGVSPYTYIWTANGVSIPSDPGRPETVRDIVNANTINKEYRVRVFDPVKRQAIVGVVVFVPNGPGDPTAAFTISPQTIQTGQTVTLNPSGSTGSITRWQWDFDWHGDIVEPFDQTINGANGTVMTSWNQGGVKYVRLRVTTAAGNFHEIFQRVRVF